MNIVQKYVRISTTIGWRIRVNESHNVLKNINKITYVAKINNKLNYRMLCEQIITLLHYYNFILFERERKLYCTPRK